MSASDQVDLVAASAANSDQVNAEDLLSGPRLVTIERVSRGSAEQPVQIHLAEFPGRTYRPCKSMIRVLIAAWGKETSTFIGRRLMLYRDPEIRFGKDTVGGIRISAMSDIPTRLTLALTITRGRRAPFTVDPLPDAPTPPAKAPTAASIIGAFDSLGVTVEQLEARIGHSSDAWTADDIAQLAALGKAIKAGTTSTFEEFEQPADDGQLPMNTTDEEPQP